MAHRTELVGWLRVSNGEHKVCIRCCGQVDTDHWHLMALMAPDETGVMRPVDKAKRDANLAAMHSFVAAQHEEALTTAQEFLDKAGVVTEHP